MLNQEHQDRNEKTEREGVKETVTRDNVREKKQQ